MIVAFQMGIWWSKRRIAGEQCLTERMATVATGWPCKMQPRGILGVPNLQPSLLT